MKLNEAKQMAAAKFFYVLAVLHYVYFLFIFSFTFT